MPGAEVEGAPDSRFMEVAVAALAVRALDVLDKRDESPHSLRLMLVLHPTFAIALAGGSWLLWLVGLAFTSCCARQVPRERRSGALRGLRHQEVTRGETQKPIVSPIAPPVGNLSSGQTG